MKHRAPARANRAILPLLGALLWGVVEFVALARSRWSLRVRQGRQA